jgi:hypothetical protein
MSQWILVSERLPNPGQVVVAIWKPAPYECQYEIVELTGGIWHNPEDTEDDYAPPIAWMPLPALPISQGAP